MLLAGVVGLSHAQENPAFSQSLQTKFQARMTSLNALMNALEKRLDAAKDYRAGIIRCGEMDMFYMPTKPSADADGCVGLGVKDLTGSETIGIATDCNKSSSNPSTSTYTIPEAIFKKMAGGQVEARFGRIGTLKLAISKGKTNEVSRYKKWKNNWYSTSNENKCTVQMSYDGGNQVKVTCSGRGKVYQCRGEMKQFDWRGKQIILK